MDATLHFNLPDDEPDFRDAIEGSDTRQALREVGEMLRSRVKYGIPPDVKTPDDAYAEMQQEYFTAVNSRNLDMDR